MSCSTVIVNNIPCALSNPDELSSKTWFGQFGQIVQVMTHCSGDSCTTYIEFVTQSSALSATNHMHGRLVYEDTSLDVQLAKGYDECSSVDFADDDKDNDDSSDYMESKCARKHTEESMCEAERAALEKQIAQLRMDASVSARPLDEAHAALRKSYSEKEQECAKLRAHLDNVTAKYDSLQKSCEWLEKQLTCALSDSQQLQRLLFLDQQQNSAATAVSSSPDPAAEASYAVAMSCELEGVPSSLTIT